jgi:uncharacterized iron-regulated membrane protein
MNRSFLFTTHSIAGLISGLFILIISLSGAILVFHDELDLLNYPPPVLRAEHKLASLDSCYSNIKNRYPHAQISHCLIPEGNENSFVFTVYDSSYKSGKDPLRLFLQPQTAAIQKADGVRTGFLSWVARMHSSFHAGKKGEWLLGFFALVFLLSTITGMVLFRRSVVAVLTFRKTVYSRSNLHQLIGVYALLFNLVIGFSGFWMQRYVFKKSFYKSYNYTPVLRSTPPLTFQFDTAMNVLHDQYPDFTPRVIYFAQGTQGNTAIYGSRSANSFIHSKKYADVIYLDSTGMVNRTAFISSIRPGDRYDIINAQIHYGQYGGLPVKIIYAMFGITGAILSITGFIMWIRRRRGKPRTAAP